MPSLQSKLFRNDPALQACLIRDSSHVTTGAVGDHVSRIQKALLILDGLHIDAGEVRTKRYGPSTASGVLTYKTRRKIVNTSYQSQADNIVGKMTIAALDAELSLLERRTTIAVTKNRCRFA